MPTLHLTRTNPTDPIYIYLRVWRPDAAGGGRMAEVHALFDTGNDHTTISAELFQALELATTGKQLSVNGVTGGANATSTYIGFGIQMDGDARVTVDKHEVAVLEGLSNPVLIGRDLLGMFDVTIKRDGSVSIAT